MQWLLNEMRDEGLSSPYPHAVCYGKTATDMSLMMMVMVKMILMMINTTLQNQDDKKHQKTQNNKFENAKSAE